MKYELNNLGVELSDKHALELSNASLSYRQCLLNLQLWLIGIPKAEKGLVESLNGISLPFSQIHTKNSNPDEIENFYQSGINIISNNRFK